MTKRLYKSSTQALGRSKSSSPARDNVLGEGDSRTSFSDRASWEDEDLIREGMPTLPLCSPVVEIHAL